MCVTFPGSISCTHNFKGIEHSQGIEMPGELFTPILSRLSVRDLNSCVSVNHQWCAILRSAETARNLMFLNFPELNLAECNDLHGRYKYQMRLRQNSENGICTIHSFGNHDDRYHERRHSIYSLAIVDQILFTCAPEDRNSTVKVWDLSSENCISSYPFDYHGYRMVVDGNNIILGTRNGAIYVCDVTSNGKVGPLVNGHDKRVNCFAIVKRMLDTGNESRVLFSGSDDATIKVWDLGSFECLTTLKVHAEGVTCFAVENNLLFSGSYDSTIVGLDISSLKTRVTLKNDDDAIYSLVARNGFLFSGSSRKIVKWDIKSLQPIRSKKCHRNNIQSLAIVDRVLISASDDNTVKILDIEFLHCIATFRDRNNFCTTLAVADGKVYADPYPLNMIKVFDFTASHHTVLRELTEKIHNDLREAKARLSRMPPSLLSSIFGPDSDWQDLDKNKIVKKITNYLKKGL
jgi:WD40 repeat protein